MLVNAVIGSIGLEPTMQAIQEGITIAIANKETLVAAGDIVMSEARKRNVALLPVDSEHSALFQSMNGENPKRVSRLILNRIRREFQGFDEGPVKRCDSTTGIGSSELVDGQ